MPMTATEMFASLFSNAPLVSLGALALAAGLHTIGRMSDRTLVVALVAIVVVCTVAERAALAPYVGSVSLPLVNGL